MYKEMFYTEDLTNLTEEVVFEQLHQLILSGTQEFCQCDVCIQDIAAIVLNQVPSKYESSFLEKVNPREHNLEIMEKIRQEIDMQLLTAIQIVHNHAHH